MNCNGTAVCLFSFFCSFAVVLGCVIHFVAPQTTIRSRKTRINERKNKYNGIKLFSSSSNYYYNITPSIV